MGLLWHFFDGWVLFVRMSARVCSQFAWSRHRDDPLGGTMSLVEWSGVLGNFAQVVGAIGVVVTLV
jgi:hypothetical protein